MTLLRIPLNFMKNSFEKLYQRFIVALIDKANGNATVICKRFYALTLMKELGLSGNHISTPKTYDTCADKTHFQLINSCGNTILTYFDISLNAENKCLPSVYWLLKLHKKKNSKRAYKITFQRCWWEIHWNTCRAQWRNKQKTEAISLTKNFLKKDVKYLLRNCSFRLGNKIFRQIISLLVGADLAPIFANLFLFHIELK